MVDATPFLPGLSPVRGKAVVARFDGGRLSSEGGLLVLRKEFLQDPHYPMQRFADS